MNDVFIHPSSEVDQPVSIGAGTKIWHWTHICKDAVIGKNCSIGQNVFIAEGVEIGDNCKIQNNVSIYSGVKLESNVFCGPSMVFTNVINPRSNVSRKSEYLKTLVKSGSTIGANATIVCGNTLAEYSFVGAGALVTKNTKSFSLNIGVPSIQVGWVTRHGEVIKKELLIENRYICQITGDEYYLEDDNLILEGKQ